jgi:glycosyltransferase involved in cell wall biosynthesis
MTQGIEKRLSIFLPGLYGGGAERILLNLAEGFVLRGYSVDLVLAQTEGAFTNQIPDKVRLVSLHRSNRNSMRTLSSLPALVRYIKKEQPDVLLSALHGNVIACWAKIISGFKHKLVLTEHNTFSIQNKEMFRIFGWLHALLVRVFYPFADEIVAVSEGVADDLAKSIQMDRQRIKVIYNPIISDMIFEKANQEPAHPFYQIPHPPIFIAIGRLSPQKDFSTLLDAFKLVRNKIDSRLVILGEGSERENLNQKIQDLQLQDDVSLPGFVDNPYTLLAHSSVFVLSSRWEGLPTVLVEAMACGLPVVSTDCPSGPREILKNGKYGLLTPVGDALSLSSGMLQGLNGSIPLAPKEAWSAFTVDHTLDEYHKVLF